MLLASEQPQRYNEMIESEFAPTRGAKEDEKFYTFRDKGQIQSIYEGLKKYIPQMKPGKSYNVGYSKDVKKGDSDFVNPGVIGMGRFQVGIGEDARGKYMSVYDKWDIDANTGVESAEKLFDWAMPGFEIYDRHYYKTPEQEIRKADKDKKKFSLRSVATGVLDKTEVDDRIFEFLKKAGQKARGIFE